MHINCMLSRVHSQHVRSSLGGADRVCFREEAFEVLHQVLHACIDLETPEVLHQVLHACLQVRPKRDLFIAAIHGCAAEKNAYVYKMLLANVQLY